MPPRTADWAARNFRNIETQFVGYGRHFIQEDNPEAIGPGILDRYRRLETKRVTYCEPTPRPARPACGA